MKKIAPFNLELITINKLSETEVVDRKNFLTCIVKLALTSTEGKLKAKILHGDTADGKNMVQYKIKDKDVCTEELTQKNTHGQFYFDLTGAKQYIKVVVEGTEAEGTGYAVALGDKICGEDFN